VGEEHRGEGRRERPARFGTLLLTGKMLVQEGQIQLAFMQVKKRPDDVRTEASLQGMTQIEAYDGKEGESLTFLGREIPNDVGDDVKALVEDAEMDGPLVDWQTKGNACSNISERRCRWNSSAQVESDAKERRRKFCLSGSDHSSRFGC